MSDKDGTSSCLNKEKREQTHGMMSHPSPTGFPLGSTAGYAKAKVREILKAEFNRSVELQVNFNIIGNVSVFLRVCFYLIQYVLFFSSF